MTQKSLWVLLLASSIVLAQTESISDTLIQEITKKEIHPRDQYELGEGYVNYPLKPPVTTSPRATLYSFIEYMNRAHSIIMKAHEENTESRGLFTADNVSEKAEQAEILFRRAVKCLDISQLPPALKSDLSYESALLLKEILDRIDLPHFSKVPDEAEIELEAETEKFPELDSWQIPNADIVISKMEEGPRKGEYLFTSRTVDRLMDYYDLTRDLPYNSSNEVSEGFYRFYIRSPGDLLPPKWVSYLPNSWSARLYYSQTIWQWLGLILSFLLLVSIIRLLFIRLVKGLSDQSTKIALFRKGIFLMACALLLILLYQIDEKFLNITGSFLVWIRLILSSIMWLLLAGATYYFINAASEALIDSEKINLRGIQRAYTKIIALIFSLFIAISIFILGLSQLGLSLIPLITGAGIGGIAIALAARSTLENVISSFSIFANKPFRLGHEIEVNGFRGTVVDIGLSKTKLRQLNGRIAIIPNKNIIDATVENIEERPFWQKELEIVISYSERPQLVHTAVDILRDILRVPKDVDQSTTEHPNHLINQPGYPPRVFFQGIDEDNQVIKMYYWYCSSDKWAFREHENYINFQIIERFKEAGIAFAIPAQSVRLEQGSDTTGQAGDQSILPKN